MLFRQCQTLMELIDTQWDVNVIEYNKGFLNAKELIDTQWDVNYTIKAIKTALIKELIDTQWDVNYCQSKDPQ